MTDEPILPPETNLLDEGGIEHHINDEEENQRLEMLAQRMPPALTPIPVGNGGAVLSPSQNDSYASQKRKRGRPPMDDSYDTFNM